MVGTTEQWREAGLSEKRIKLLVASGELVRVCRGCYVAKETLAEAKGDPRLDHAVKAGAVVLSSRRRDCVASHHSAARVHGIEMLHPPEAGVVTVTVESGRLTGRHGNADVVRHAAGLPGHHVTKFRGLPLTTVARTVVDIARVSTFMQGVVAADSALHKDPAQKFAMCAVVEECGRWPGIEMARRVVEFADWVPESVMESCARVVFYEHGLPPPEFQIPILGMNGRVVAKADFCWPQFGAIAEADGIEKYTKRGDFKAHHQRDSRIREVGWEVAHFLWDELFAVPADVVARVRFAFDRGMEPSAVKRRKQFFQFGA